MRAVRVIGKGKEARLELGEAETPEPGPDELRIDVAASAVNRADLMQRRGLYPPPPGASPILGLECAGVVERVGGLVRGFAPGDRVMALLPGGGYAEQAVAHAGSVLRIPEGMSLLEAAAIPEVFLTCHLTLFQIAGAHEGQSALVHGGGSGIGTAAIQMLKRAGVRVFTTAGSDDKCARCCKLGAELAVNYRTGDFVGALRDATGGAGVDVVLDAVGGAYLDKHMQVLARGGKLVLIGLMGGARAELDLGAVLSRHLLITGSTLRSRPVEEKAGLVRAFLERFGADLAARRIRPVVDCELPLARAQEAHDRVEASQHFGKVVLRVLDA
jgi:putative PIG3 family NAD(P)H quinone oxidoreductase